MAPCHNSSILAHVGCTPVVRIKNIEPEKRAQILAKMEYFNPGGSVKDRIAAHIIEVAEGEGKLRPGGTIVEATSGNTGIGLAMAAAAKGYRLILVMPDSMSQERQTLLKSYGVELYLTPGKEGMRGSIQVSEQLLKENPGHFAARQFENPANPEIHRRTTAKEILRATGGKLDAFVAGVGTGGTITGVGEVLRQELGSRVKVYAVEPAASPVLSGGRPGPHRIQGIGAGFVPPVLNRSIIDEVIKVDDLDAYLRSIQLCRSEGLFVGISSGAAMHAALQVARELGPGKRLVTVLPDTGERYLSMAPYFRLDLRKKGIEV